MVTKLKQALSAVLPERARTAYSGRSESSSAFLRQSSLGLALVCLVLLTPFGVNNIVQGRYVIGVGILLLLLVFAFNTYTVLVKRRYYDLLSLTVLAPAVILFLSFSIRQQGMIGVLWCYPTAVSFYFMLPERRAWIANAALFGITAPLIWQLIEPALAVRVSVTLVMVSIFAAIFVRVITSQQSTLHTQAVTDQLTKLFNRALLPKTLECATEQSKRAIIPMTLVSLDIDHFKAINDTLGHAAGDQVLQGLGALLNRRVRRADWAFRLGGEEFLILLYNTDGANARYFTKMLCQEFAALELLERPLTLSAGVATLKHNESWEAWLKRSDDNLYRAKQQGRNCVVL